MDLQKLCNFFGTHTIGKCRLAIELYLFLSVAQLFCALTHNASNVQKHLDFSRAEWKSSALNLYSAASIIISLQMIVHSIFMPSCLIAINITCLCNTKYIRNFFQVHFILKKLWLFKVKWCSWFLNLQLNSILNIKRFHNWNQVLSP